MEKEFWTVTEVTELFQVEESFLSELEREEIICSTCREGSPAKFFSCTELEKLRIAKNLIEDMGVNLSGVEIILRMRKNMIDMRRQFDAILEEIRNHIQERLKAGR